MSEKNGNGEKRWLRWIVRLALPALVAALWGVQWASLSSQLDGLWDEVRELRGEVRDELNSQRLVNREQDGRLARLYAEVGFLRDDGRGD
ncbi:MAG TPA: hypothetical protein VM054_05020 [bacterium]|nr:hypothetical protein [bacterium]